MKKDQTIEEIRTVRHMISERFGHDTKTLLDHYRELEKKYPDRILPNVTGKKEERIKLRTSTIISEERSDAGEG